MAKQVNIRELYPANYGRDLPPGYGDWKNTHRRFCRWRDKGPLGGVAGKIGRPTRFRMADDRRQSYADPGALIQAGTSSDSQSLPLVRVSDNYLLRLDFPVSVDDIQYVNVGDVASVD